MKLFSALRFIAHWITYIIAFFQEEIINKLWSKRKRTHFKEVNVHFWHQQTIDNSNTPFQFVHKFNLNCSSLLKQEKVRTASDNEKHTYSISFNWSRSLLSILRINLKSTNSSAINWIQQHFISLWKGSFGRILCSTSSCSS